MIKILQTKIPPTSFFLLIWFMAFGSFFFFIEKTPIKWVAIIGLGIYAAAKIGQQFASGQEEIFDFFTIFSKTGALIGVGAIILKARLIIKQQGVYALGNHVQSTAAVSHGILLFIFALAMAIYVIKKVD